MAITLDDILDRLSPVMPHFTEAHWDVARAVAAVLLRGRMIDEAVWLQIQRYATQHVIWAELVLDLQTDEAEAAKGFGSMKVQRLAYQEKILGGFERELFLTPAARKEKLGSEQANFFDLLGGGSGPAPAAPQEGRVTPFQPRRRAIGG